MFFYDAAAPIVERDSINMKVAFWGERYEQERLKDEQVEDWQKNEYNLKMKQVI